MSYFLELVQKGDDELTKLNHQEAYRYYSEAHRIEDDPLLLLRMARAVSGISLASGVMNVGSAYNPFLEDLNRAVSSAEPSKKKLVEEDAAYAACYFASIILSETTKHYANHGIDDTVSDNLEKSKGLLSIAESYASSANIRLNKPAEQLMNAAQSDDLLLQSTQIHDPHLIALSEVEISDKNETDQSSPSENSQNVSPSRIDLEGKSDPVAYCTLNSHDVAVDYISKIDGICAGNISAGDVDVKEYPYRLTPSEKRKFLRKLEVESAQLGTKEYEEHLLVIWTTLAISALVGVVIVSQSTEWLLPASMIFHNPSDVLFEHWITLSMVGILMMVPHFRRLLSIVLFLILLSVFFPLFGYLFDLFDAESGVASAALAFLAAGICALPSFAAFTFLDREYAASKERI